ncbi:lytic murein transglycosylase [Rhizobium leguminosarum]|nr:lytic murein transglycosylase [Rhizobium leguminosarum]
MRARRGAPLCPAGHLPRKGGDRQEAVSRPQFTIHVTARCLGKPSPHPISAPVGEMPGRAERVSQAL